MSVASRLRTAMAVLALLLACGPEPSRPAQAQGTTQDPTTLEDVRLTGDWGGLRKKLEEHGVEPSLVYTGSMWSNVGGGLRTGTEFNGYVDLGLSVDLTELGAWHGFGFAVSGHWFQGRSPSMELVGVNLSQAVNPWEASNAVRVYNLYFTQDFGSAVLLHVGQMATDTDFTVSRYASTFLNATFGDLPPQNLNLDVPTYPLPGPGVYVKSSVGEDATSRLGWYTANSGRDTASNHGFGWQLGRNAGYAIFSELELDETPGGLPGDYTLGGYFASVREPKLDGTGFVYALWGGWLMVDQALRVDAQGDPVVGVFARLSYSPADEHNVVLVYADAGINVIGPIASRPKDVLGFAGSVLRSTDDLRREEQKSGMLGLGGEAVLELTYQIQAMPWLTVQPDLQYVIDPLASGNDATVIGLQMVATF